MDYKDLKAWQQSMDLVERIYELAKTLPKEETYALSDQLRRAVVSVPSNIAEGQNRNTNKEFIQFLYIALGSISEVETQLMICERLNYLSNIDGTIILFESPKRLMKTLNDLNEILNNIANNKVYEFLKLVNGNDDFDALSLLNSLKIFDTDSVRIVKTG